MKSAGSSGFLPGAPQEVKILLDLCTLEKTLYELTYELNNRPDWVHAPIQGMLDILQPKP